MDLVLGYRCNVICADLKALFESIKNVLNGTI